VVPPPPSYPPPPPTEMPPEVRTEAATGTGSVVENASRPAGESPLARLRSRAAALTAERLAEILRSR
jgi:hypothetical protein